jgi:hypothetical protein
MRLMNGATVMTPAANRSPLRFCEQSRPLQRSLSLGYPELSLARLEATAFRRRIACCNNSCSDKYLSDQDPFAP